MLNRTVSGAIEGGDVLVRGGYRTVVWQYPRNCTVPKDVSSKPRRSSGTRTRLQYS